VRKEVSWAGVERRVEPLETELPIRPTIVLGDMVGEMEE